MTDAELTELDLAVARVLWPDANLFVQEGTPFTYATVIRRDDMDGFPYDTPFSFTRYWADCGPLISQFNLIVSPAPDGSGWTAGAMPKVDPDNLPTVKQQGRLHEGSTPQIAICRAIVASGG